MIHSRHPPPWWKKTTLWTITHMMPSQEAILTTIMTDLSPWRPQSTAKMQKWARRSMPALISPRSTTDPFSKTKTSLRPLLRPLRHRRRIMLSSITRVAAGANICALLMKGRARRGSRSGTRCRVVCEPSQEKATARCTTSPASILLFKGGQDQDQGLQAFNEHH